MSPIETVQSIYAAFGRGDVPAIMALLADDVEWEYGTFPSPVPWLQPLRGRAQVPAFFQSLAAVQLTKFVPRQMFGDARTVVSLVDVELVVHATGKRIVEEDEVHVWHFDDAGRVARFRHRVDTHQHVQALARE